MDIRNKAAGSEVNLSIYPSAENINLNEAKSFDVMANFTNGSPGEKLTYFKVVITFAKDYLYIPPGKYIDTGKSGFSKVFRVDGPMVANNTGIINIELGALSPNDGPDTGSLVRIGKIYLSGKSVTSDTQLITISKAQVVNAQNSELPVNLGKAAYSVVAPIIPNASPTVPVLFPIPSTPIFVSLVPAILRNSPTPYNSNPRISVSIMPTAKPRIESFVPQTNYISPAQVQGMPLNQINENSSPNRQEQPTESNLFQIPTPTIFLPDYISPTPTKPSSIFTGFFNFLHNIFCSIFRICK